MKKISKYIELLVILIPLVIGNAGLIIEGNTLLDAMYKCIKMYTFGFDAAPGNILVEIARWMAPLATLSFIAVSIKAVGLYFINYVRYLTEDTVAVYGDEFEKDQIVRQLGKRSVICNEDLIDANTYILVWDEERNLEFYHQNADQLKDSEVYIKCNSLSSQTSVLNNPKVHLFSLEETASRVFWKENCLYAESKKNSHRLMFSIVGWNQLSENLLLYGLQNNIFSADQQIEYHIFGDAGQFMNVHHELTSIEDKIVIHNETWDEGLKTLENSNLILVMEQTEQLKLTSNLLLATLIPEVVLFSCQNIADSLFTNESRLKVYKWKEVAYRIDYILSAELYRRAKAINLRYANLYSGVKETEENKEKEWEKLSTFTRYSNISSADYHEVRLKMLKEMGVSVTNVDSATLELLANLEHIRWNRYHLINNWRYGKPVNGKSKDEKLRIHSDLVSYAQLTEEEKEKDRDNIRTLLSIK